ncbi:hypothetical protein CBR_g33971 [Chara braunii]|uniref:Peptidase A2 domain-containing protein n=1 Tax=Chara braunii TaxID=69332 RepID=A0A388LHQ2_CHABU|nr:hypothetical protein CBR_g33971 [Chara braunii]|eukprot:GBG81791.1 hypothetical protein CBR_g33971 [Chara braunii]
MEELAGTSTGQQETEAEEQEKVYRKPREDKPVDKATAAKKKFRCQIPILTSPEIDGTLSKLLGTMVSVSFQTMLQASPRLLKGLRQLLTRKRVEVEEAPELQEQDTEEVEAPQGVSNLQSIPRGLGDLEKVFADIRLSLPDREGGEVMRARPETKLSFHALPVGKLKVQIGTHHTDALVDGGAEITLIRQDFATVTGWTVNKEVAGSIRGAGGEIPFTGADGLSRVCITPEGVEDAEPIDAFLEYEGGTLVVDNEMADPAITMGQLLIQTLEKSAPPIVTKLREGPATMVRRKEEKDSWGAEVGAKEELMAMTVEGGRDDVMTLAETWAQECQYLVNLTWEERGTDQNEQEFFLIQMYEGVFKEIGLLLVGNKQPTEVSPKAREEVEKYVLRNGHLFKREEGMMPRRVVCGRSRQLDVIQAMHDGLAGGHRSSKGTLAKIVPLYFWPGMAGMVATYCHV